MEVSMCGIFGYACMSSFGNPLPSSVGAEPIRRMLSVMAKSESTRGGPARYAFGGVDGSVKTTAFLTPDIDFQRYRCGIGVSRAIPTTESGKRDPIGNEPPVSFRDVVVAHNGIIANDKELLWRLEGVNSNWIDSTAIARLLHHQAVWEYSASRVILPDLLRQLDGSFAFAAIHARHPGRLILARNYKPLYVWQLHDLLIFASQRRTLEAVARELGSWTGKGVYQSPREVPPYSFLFHHPDREPGAVSWSPFGNDSDKPAVILCSGGLDSAVAIGRLDPAKHVILFARYGQRTEGREARAARDLADYYGFPYHEADLRSLASLFKSNLLSGEVNLDGAAGAERPTEWVPARNSILAMIGVGMAESVGAMRVVLGTNIEEAGAYPDNDPELINKINWAMPYIVGPGKRVRLVNPVGGLTKAQIVAEGILLRVPMELTWSCYQGSDEHCGKCASCYYRAHAFRANGVKDPAFEGSWSDGFWSDCSDYAPVVS